MKVRIALTIDDEGCWSAYGSGESKKPMSDGSMLDIVLMGGATNDHYAVYFVEAEVEPPKAMTVKGTATPSVPE